MDQHIKSGIWRAHGVRLNQIWLIESILQIIKLFKMSRVCGPTLQDIPFRREAVESVSWRWHWVIRIFSCKKEDAFTSKLLHFRVQIHLVLSSNYRTKKRVRAHRPIKVPPPPYFLLPPPNYPVSPAVCRQTTQELADMGLQRVGREP